MLLQRLKILCRIGRCAKLYSAIFGLGLSCVFATASPQAQESRDVYISTEAGGPPTRIYQKSFALVIGIDDYKSGWARLTHAVSDAETVARTLASQGFETRLEKNLSGDQLEQTFKEWFLLAGQQDDARLVVWFAGHGHTIQRPGSNSVNAYIVPVDAPNPTSVPQASRRQVEVEFLRRSLSLTRFSELMKQATARHVLVIFDSCFAGQIFSAVRATPPAISTFTLHPARQFITSGTEGQTVSDNGMFQRLFVDAISGQEPDADANKDGFVTANELGLFLKQKVTDLSRGRQTPDYGPLREEGFDRGDFVFVLPSSSPSKMPSSANVDAAVMERVWAFVRDLRSPDATEKFLKDYPDSPYRSVAETQIKALRHPGEVITTLAKAETKIEPSERVRAVPILFGTDRKQEDGRFGSLRAGQLATGRASVSVPESHRLGTLETAVGFFSIFQQTVDTKRHFSLLSIERNQDNRVPSAPQPSASVGRDAFIYVHGFNTTFEYALFRAAQLAWDLNFNGTAAAFSWPSKANATSYIYDQESALRSAEYLQEFIKLIRAQPDIGKVHIIAHAQGALPVMTALDALAQDRDHAPFTLGEVVLVSPDVDANVFNALCQRVKTVARRITVYASDNDKALLAAYALAQGNRAGLIVGGQPTVFQCADVIDVSAAVESSVALGLTPFGSPGMVLADIGHLLSRADGSLLSPESREPRLRVIGDVKGKYWKYMN